MNTLFEHVALLPIVAVVVNALIAQYRVPAFVAAHGGDRSDASRFIWGGAGLFILFFAAIDAWVHASGTGSVLCFIPTFTPHSPSELAAWAVYLALPIGLALWSWLGSGADVIARYMPLFAKSFKAELTYKPRMIRWFTLYIVASTLIVPAMMTNARPRGLDCAPAGNAAASTLGSAR